MSGLESDNVLNFHFLIFYIYLKKSCTLSDKEEVAELQAITEVVVEKLI